LRRHLQPAAALNDVITSAARLALLSLSRPFGSAPLPFQDLSDQFQSASDNFRETSFFNGLHAMKRKNEKQLQALKRSARRQRAVVCGPLAIWQRASPTTVVLHDRR